MKRKKSACMALVMMVFAGFLVGASAAEPAKDDGRLKPKLHDGYRGFPIPVERYQAQYLKKGDRVDMMVTFEAKMADNVMEKVTATMLQNVIVVDVRPAEDSRKASVFLLLNPRETQYAALSMVQGELSFAVRSEGDTKMIPMEMSSFRKLFK